MPKLRISTFNCENLFSRPKILNFDDNDDAEEPPDKLAKLNKILAKPKYSDADKTTVSWVRGELADCVDLNELRGKLASKHKVVGKMIEYIKPDGRGDWVGSVALKRDPIPLAAQESTAEVIKAVNADIQSVVEVEDRLALESFSKKR